MPRPGEYLNAERDAEIAILRATGMPFRHIARRYGISHERVRNILKAIARREAPISEEQTP